jgi:DNA-directed RNA polymerase specialized sigma24 family protein
MECPMEGNKLEKCVDKASGHQVRHQEHKRMLFSTVQRYAKTHLSDEGFTLFTLLHIQGCTHAEAAEKVDSSQDAVHKKNAAMVQQLKRALGDEM